MVDPRFMISVSARTPSHAITPAAPKLRAAPSLCAHSCSRADTTRKTQRHKGSFGIPAPPPVFELFS